MQVTSVNLETVCGITSKIPDNKMLEVAFAGRSAGIWLCKRIAGNGKKMGKDDR